MFEFPEYKTTIEASSIEEAKKILQAEITAGNLTQVPVDNLGVKSVEEVKKEIKK